MHRPYLRLGPIAVSLADGEVELMQDRFVYEWYDAPQGNMELEATLQGSLPIKWVQALGVCVWVPFGAGGVGCSRKERV